MCKTSICSGTFYSRSKCFTKGQEMGNNKKRRSKAILREEVQAYLFIFPLLFGIIFYNILPIFSSAVISLTDWDIMTQPTSVGFENYSKLFKDDIFKASFINTLYYTGVSVPLQVVVAFFLALLLNFKIKGSNLFRACFFMPVVTSVVAVSTVWYWIYNSEYGLINLLIYQVFGIAGPNWLGSKDWAMPSIIIMSLWKNAGYYMVIFLAALQGVPQELYESARIDGASSWKQLYYITIPVVSPTTFFVVIMATISSFQMFEQSYVMTAGGPSYSTITLVLSVFNHAFKYFRMGYASAQAWILFLLIMFITFIQKIFQKKWVFYT